MSPARGPLATLAAVVLLGARAAASGSSSSAPGGSGPTATPLPSWLSHVDGAVLRRNADLAESRHADAIRTALENFNTDGADADAAADAGEGGFDLKALEFDRYEIDAPGYWLPDFHDELGDQPVLVTRRDTPLFSEEECSGIVRMAEEYYSSEDREWPTLPSGQYYIQGFWIKDGPPEIKEWFVRMVKTRLFEVLRDKFPDFVGDSTENLVVDNAYMFKYTAKPGLRTEIHTDAGCLSFTFALNSNSNYEGGGTYVEGLTLVDEEGKRTKTNNILEMDVGQCTVRPGGLRHGGNPLESGVRYIVGGFCMHKKKVETVRMLLEPSDDENVEREALEAAIAFNAKSDLPYARLAHIYEKNGDQSKALNVVEDCLAIANPASASAAYHLGTASYKSGDYQKCIRMMRICLDVDPKDGDALQSLYQSYAKLGMADEEREVLRRVVSAPGVSSRVLANAHVNIGVSCEDVDDEVGHYLDAINHDPGHIAAWHSFGSALASQRKWEPSVRAFKRAMELIAAGDGSGEDSTPEKRGETLTCLYRAATQQLKGELASDNNPPADRGVILGRLKNIMGEKSYAEMERMQRRV